MIVLGTNSDDKGTQLENLTRTLLEKRGYRNVCRSWIGAGGDEIDVQGEFQMPTLGQGKVFRLICECKAYKATVSLPDWLKFCGKSCSKALFLINFCRLNFYRYSIQET
jgi:hypothetical protein